MTASSAVGMEPRCPGRVRPCATSFPRASQNAVEKSMLSLITPEYDVRTMVSAISSAMANSAFLKSSRAIGSCASVMGCCVSNGDYEAKSRACSDDCRAPCRWGGEGQEGGRFPLVMQDLRQELHRPLRSRLAEEVVLLRVLDDLAAVHEDHAVCYLLREAHLVRDHHHGHSLLGELNHHVQDLIDHLGVERRGRLIEQHRDRVHRQPARDRDPLLLSPRELARVLVRVLLQADAVEVLHPSCS